MITRMDIAAAHQRSLARVAEIRRQIANMTGSQPLILRHAVITLEAELLNSDQIQRRYHIISTDGYWAGKSWLYAEHHADRVTKALAAYGRLALDSTPPLCGHCETVLIRPNRRAKYCSPSCQRQASNLARYHRNKMRKTG